MTTAPADARLSTIATAGWRLLGAARDLPADVEALAHALHDQECGCEDGPDDEMWTRAAELVQAGWRRSGTAALDLANLLAAVGKAWDAATTGPASTAERDRWTPVVDLAARIAQEVLR